MHTKPTAIFMDPGSCTMKGPLDSDDAVNDDNRLHNVGADEPSDDTPAPPAEIGNEGVVTDDPHNPDNWQMLMGEDGGEFSPRFDSGEGEDADDIHFLTDHALEDVDDFLQKPGRLGVVDDSTMQVDQRPHQEPESRPIQQHTAAAELEAAASSHARKRRNSSSYSSGSTIDKVESSAANSGRDAEGLGADNKDKNTENDGLLPVENKENNSARGSGAQAAKTIANGESGAVQTDLRKPVYSPPTTTIPINQQNPTVWGLESPERYCDDSTSYEQSAANSANPPCNAQPAVAVDPSSLSPTRSRLAKKVPPFVQAKGLSLTYAQAKLFGLAGPACPGSPPKPSATGDCCSQPVPLEKVLHAARSSPWYSGATAEKRYRHPTTGVVIRRGSNCSGQSNKTLCKYSKSRMEDLARPVAGFPIGEEAVNRVGGRDTGGARDDEPSFTWKRTRKAEVAMRNPACGYDFVAQAGATADHKGFLGRVEAYSHYSRAKMETRRAEEEYNARLDKLHCPRCRSPQSYDEYSTKKLKCPTCDVAYCMLKTWKRRVWEQRNEICAMKSDERQANIEREAEEEFRRRRPRQTRHAALLRQQVGKVGFMARMRIDLRRRRTLEGIIKCTTITADIEQPHDRGRYQHQHQHERQRPASAGNATTTPVAHRASKANRPMSAAANAMPGRLAVDDSKGRPPYALSQGQRGTERKQRGASGRGSVIADDRAGLNVKTRPATLTAVENGRKRSEQDRVKRRQEQPVVSTTLRHRE